MDEAVVIAVRDERRAVSQCLAHRPVAREEEVPRERVHRPLLIPKAAAYPRVLSFSNLPCWIVPNLSIASFLSLEPACWQLILHNRK